MGISAGAGAASAGAQADATTQHPSQNEAQICAHHRKQTPFAGDCRLGTAAGAVSIAAIAFRPHSRSRALSAR